MLSSAKQSPECAPNSSYPLSGFGGVGDGDESESELSNRICLYILDTALCFSSLAASVSGFAHAAGAGAAAGTTFGADMDPAPGAGAESAIGCGTGMGAVMGCGTGSV